MIVKQYGLTYKRINADDLELIRYWRNQPFIRETMQFKDYITPAMQQKWFNKINNKFNYYFIIEHGDKKIGLISCKDTSPNREVAEGGIFIWNKNYWGTPFPVFASLTVLEAVFEVFRSGTASVATVAKSNLKALEFNKLLGYEIECDAENPEFLKLMLTKENYLSKTAKLKKAAHNYTKGKSKFEIIAKPSDLFIEEINQFLKNKSTT